MSVETIAGYLGARGLRVSESDLVHSIDAALGDRLASPSAAALTPAAQGFLAEYGGITLVPDAARRVVVSTIGHLAAAAESAMTVAEAAELLGVDPSRIRHRIAAGAIYAMRLGRRNMLPQWQFHETGALPYIAEVLAALPDDLHPLEVAEFFTESQSELIVKGAEVSPRTWLAGGGEPEPVIDIAASLAHMP